MVDGNWLIGGENHWDDAAMAISGGNNLTKWKMVTGPRPDDLKLLYPEAAIVDRGGGNLLIFYRPPEEKPGIPGALPTPFAESHDCGHTWTELALSNFPMAQRQPFAGKLSTGHKYLLTNNLEDDRFPLSIALTGPEGGLFKPIFKIRHQQWPKIRLLGRAVGKPTGWSYPNAFEHDGNL